MMIQVHADAAGRPLEAQSSSGGLRQGQAGTLRRAVGVALACVAVTAIAAGPASASPVQAPEVSGESFSGLASSEVVLSAEINPGGATTTYDVEYEPGKLSPQQSLPAAAGSVKVQVRLTGLSADTEYHFHFLAKNPAGLGEGPSEAFTTSATSSALPDGRVDELVSTAGAFGEPDVPPDPRGGAASPGAGAGNMTFNLFQAAADGNRVVYPGEGAENAGGGYLEGGAVGDDWLATRTPSGWVPAVISPLSGENSQEGESEPVFQFFTEDLSSAVLSSNRQPSLAGSNPRGCENLYFRDAEDGSYSPLVDAPAECGSGSSLFAGASAIGDNVLFQTTAALTQNATPAVESPYPSSLEFEKGLPCEFGCNLYLIAGGKLRLVNVLPGPEEQTVANATFGGGYGQPDFSNAISTDGSRVFWTDTREGVSQIYVLEDDNVTVPVSGPSPAQYWTATPDGRDAVYTENGALWAYDTNADTHEVLAGAGLHGEAAAVEGVLGTNQSGADLAYVYFVASNVLASNANEHHDVPQLGQPNLYVRHAGVTTFVATLSPSDDNLKATESPNSGTYGDWAPDVGERTAQVSAEGGYVGFESIQPLTGYDNRDTGIAGHPVLEVFLYDASTGRLSCASCNPVGRAPNAAEPEVTEGEPDTLVPISDVNRTTERRWLSGNGHRVFFDTPQPLVSQANRKWNVYEWEAEGEGTCTAERVSVVTHGCTFLLSGENSDDESLLVDADTNGDNVFLTHRGALGQIQAPADRMGLFDIRVNGGFPDVPVGCVGGSCLGSPAPVQVAGSPSSTSEMGSGNVPPVTGPAKKHVQTRAQLLAHALATCRKQKTAERRKRCRARARARYVSRARAGMRRQRSHNS